MKKLLVLFIGLFIMVNGAVFAQETDDDTDGSQEGYITGSVSTSEYSIIPIGGESGGIQLMQQQSYNGVEVRAELHWGYTNICLWFNCWMQGKAITRYASGSILMNLCARVSSLKRNGGHVTNTGINCNYFSQGEQIDAVATWQGDPRGASWINQTWHYAEPYGSTSGWNPTLQTSVNL